MIELAEICRHAESLRERGIPRALATVVRVTGSAYRRPGARMLIADDRWIAGSVSGGCLERDVLMRGAFHIRRGAPAVVTYDSTADDDELQWGLGVGCNGVVEVLIERIDEGAALDPLAFVGSCFDEDRCGVLVTAFESDDEAAAPVGARIAIRDSAPRVEHSTFPAGPIDQAIRKLALRALFEEADGARGRARIERVGPVSVLVERITPPPHLFVVGTRHDALPLVVLARAMGIAVTVFDAPGSATVGTRERFASADRLRFGSADDLGRLVDAKSAAAVVVMTHDYARDQAFLTGLLETRALYIGILGPRARTMRMLAERGVALDDDVLSRLHAPVGLDLGAETPREIALSIVSEIQATLAGGSGRALRDRDGAIHGDAPVATRARRDIHPRSTPSAVLDAE